MVRLPHCVAVVLLSSVCVADTHNITAAERRALIRRAQVWKRTDVSSMDVKAGPQRKDGFAAGETITCDYVPEKLSGASPKFSCALGNLLLDVLQGRCAVDLGLPLAKEVEVRAVDKKDLQF